MTKRQHLAQIVREVLNARSPRRISEDGSSYRHAAVLIPIFKDDEGYKLLFTQRTDAVEEHKGQISFPGGGVEEGDGSFLGTALRETCEEIGLHREDVEVLGPTDDALTVVSNFVIHPFVGLIPHPYPFCLNPREVERLIEAPLLRFARPDPEDPAGDERYRMKRSWGPVYACGQDLIWGATARIVANFMGIIGPKLGLPSGKE